MTYIPLYRKYRPQTFSDLIGQEHITQALSNAIKLNKVAHAYLFCGPRGTGKTSSARIFAKSLNCVNGPTTEPCGQCPSCIDITNTNPVDVVEIDAASNRSVEDAQNILEKIQYVPIHGKYKIYIIDEVHMLSPTAFNALLKTLEEPPENVVFILATTEAHKVLETIISRCQKFDFRRITIEDIVKRLEFISQEEKINITKEALYSIAKSSQGGMRDSLALLDQLSILDTQKQIDVQDVENLLGKISTTALFELTEKIISGNQQEAVLEINKIYAKGNEPIQIISNLIEYFRNLLIIKTCTERETVLSLTQLNNELVEKLSAQTDRIDATTINYVIDKLANYLREIKNATNRYLWLEVCVIELSNNITTTGFSDLINRITELENAISNGAQPKTTTITQKPVQVIKPVQQPVVQSPKTETQTQPIQEEATSIQKEDKQEIQAEQETPKNVTTPSISGNETDLWQNLLSKISSLPSKMFFLNLSTPILISDTKVTIGFTKDVFVKQSKEDARITPLKSAVTEFFGKENIPIEIKLISEADAQQTKKKIVTNTATVPEQPKTEQKTNNNPQNDDNEDDASYYEQQLQEAQAEKHPQPPSHSDQAKMILDLFNGKYMD